MATDQGLNKAFAILKEIFEAKLGEEILTITSIEFRTRAKTQEAHGNRALLEDNERGRSKSQSCIWNIKKQTWECKNV